MNRYINIREKVYNLGINYCVSQGVYIIDGSINITKLMNHRIAIRIKNGEFIIIKSRTHNQRFTDNIKLINRLLHKMESHKKISSVDINSAEELYKFTLNRNHR